MGHRCVLSSSWYWHSARQICLLLNKFPTQSNLHSSKISNWIHYRSRIHSIHCLFLTVHIMTAKYTAFNNTIYAEILLQGRVSLITKRIIPTFPILLFYPPRGPHTMTFPFMTSNWLITQAILNLFLFGLTNSARAGQGR